MFGALLLSLLSATSTTTLSAKEAVGLALRSAPTLVAQAYAEEQAHLARRQAELARVHLRVDAQVAELWAQSDLLSQRGEATGGALGLSNLQASLEVPLFSGFRVEAGIDRAAALEEASHHDRLAEAERIALSTVRAYWAVRRADLLLAVEAEALARLREAEVRAQARVAAGLASPAELARAEAGRRLEEALIVERRARRQEAEVALEGLIGSHLSARPTDPAELPPLPAALEPADVEGPARPELRAAQARRRAAEHGITEAESGYYPNLALSGLVQYGNNPVVAGAGARAVYASANPFAGLGADAQLGAIASINLFDTFTTTSRVAQAEAEAARQERLVAERARTLANERAAQRARLTRSHQVEAALVQAQATAAETTRLLARRYQDGAASLFELLEAELARIEVERRRAENLADGSLAGLELELAEGRLSALGGER